MADISFKEAIELGNVHVVNELLNISTVNINNIIYDDLTPLMYAMKFVFDRECEELAQVNNLPIDSVRRGLYDKLFSYRDDDITLRLISAGCDLNARDSYGMTPLMIALKYKRGYETIYKLVDAGSDINAKCGYGNTPLMYAVEYEYNKKLIDHLISMGAEVNCTNEIELLNALFYAVKNNDVEVAEALLNAGANAHALDCKGHNILSYICCTNCNEVNCKSKRIVDLLLTNGVDLKRVDRDNNSLLHVVGCNYLFDLCIRSGVSVNVRNNDGCTPLMIALQLKKGYETIYKLLDAGSDINAKYHNGKTPLMFAVENKYNKKLIVDLISMGADVNSTNEIQLLNALFYAVENNDVEVAEALLNAGANAHALDYKGRNVLSYIRCTNCNEVNCKSKGIVDLLLTNGVDVKRVDNRNNSLINVVLCNYLIGLCIRSGVSVNARNNDGCTPLMDAIAEEDVDKVNSLLLFGADCSRIFHNALSDIKYDMRYTLFGCKEIVRLLLYHGADLCVKNDVVNTTILDIMQDRYDLDDCRNGILEYMKNVLIFSDEKVVNGLFEDLRPGDYEAIIILYENFQKELTKLKNTYLIDGLTFFEFCNLKRFYKSKLVDISIEECKYNFQQIKELFPICHDEIVIRLKDNHIKLNKRNLLRSLENIVMKPISVNNENDTDVELNFDCFYYMCRNFNNKELYNLFLASIE